MMLMYHNMVSGLYLICGEGPFQSIRRHLSSSTSCSTTFQSGVATPLFDLPSADNGGSACTEARGTCHFTYEAEEELEERRYSDRFSEEEDSDGAVYHDDFNLTHEDVDGDDNHLVASRYNGCILQHS